MRTRAIYCGNCHQSITHIHRQECPAECAAAYDPACCDKQVACVRKGQLLVAVGPVVMARSVLAHLTPPEGPRNFTPGELARHGVEYRNPGVLACLMCGQERRDIMDANRRLLAGWWNCSAGCNADPIMLAARAEQRRKAEERQQDREELMAATRRLVDRQQRQ